MNKNRLNRIPQFIALSLLVAGFVLLPVSRPALAVGTAGADAFGLNGANGTDGADGASADGADGGPVGGDGGLGRDGGDGNRRGHEEYDMTSGGAGGPRRGLRTSGRRGYHHCRD